MPESFDDIICYCGLHQPELWYGHIRAWRLEYFKPPRVMFWIVRDYNAPDLTLADAVNENIKYISAVIDVHNSTNDIEVTPEMVEAGADELLFELGGRDCFVFVTPSELAERVYLAMHTAMRKESLGDA